MQEHELSLESLKHISHVLKSGYRSWPEVCGSAVLAVENCKGKELTDLYSSTVAIKM